MDTYTKLHRGAVTFSLEEFLVGDQPFNFTLIRDNEGLTYPPKEYCLFYVSGEEVEIVKNFLTTIRS